MSEEKSQDPTKGERNATTSDQEEQKILDPQTLENLAAFLNREPEDTKNDQTYEPKESNPKVVEYSSLIPLPSSLEASDNDDDEKSPSPNEGERDESRSDSRSRSRSAEKTTGRWLYVQSSRLLIFLSVAANVRKMTRKVKHVSVWSQPPREESLW